MTYVGKKPADIIATAVDTTTGTFSGDLTVDTNTLYVDSANNKVGVGTVSPAHALDVNGSLSSNGNENVMRIAAADSTQAGGININSVYGATASSRVTTIFSIDGQGQDAPLAFGNGTTEAMRIDSSGRALINLTGEVQSSNAKLQISNTADDVVLINRTNDGDQITFHVNGNSASGSIGTNGTRFYLAGSGRGLAVDESAYSVLPVTTTGANSDGGVGLGSASARFSNLYLSGGVYVGGTGSANYLQDYETGTWTPSMGGTTTYYYQTGEYTKIGNMVFLRGQVSINAIGTGSTFTIQGLPFASKTTLNGNPAGSLTVTYYSGLAISVNYIGGHVTSASTNITIIANAGNNTTIQYNGGAFFGNGARLDFTMAYQT